MFSRLTPVRHILIKEVEKRLLRLLQPCAVWRHEVHCRERHTANVFDTKQAGDSPVLRPVRSAKINDTDHVVNSEFCRYFVLSGCDVCGNNKQLLYTIVGIPSRMHLDEYLSRNSSEKASNMESERRTSLPLALLSRPCP